MTEICCPTGRRTKTCFHCCQELHVNSLATQATNCSSERVNSVNSPQSNQEFKQLDIPEVSGISIYLSLWVRLLQYNDTVTTKQQKVLQIFNRNCKICYFTKILWHRNEICTDDCFLPWRQMYWLIFLSKYTLQRAKLNYLSSDRVRSS